VNGNGFAYLIFGGGLRRRYAHVHAQRRTDFGRQCGGCSGEPDRRFLRRGELRRPRRCAAGRKNADDDTKADVIAGSDEGSPAKVRIYLGKNFTGTGEPGTFQELAVFGGGTSPGGVFGLNSELRRKLRRRSFAIMLRENLFRHEDRPSVHITHEVSQQFDIAPECVLVSFPYPLFSTPVRAGRAPARS
jgi:hypothetical protein